MSSVPVVARVASLLRAARRRFDSEIWPHDATRVVVAASLPAALVFAALSASGATQVRVTPAPPRPPVASPFVVGASTTQDAACQLSVRVRNDVEGRDAIADAGVALARIGADGVQERLYATTDHVGTHRFIGLTAGHYEVTVDVPGRALQGAPPFVCVRGDERAFLDVTVRATEHIVSGRIVDREGRALPSAEVAIGQEEGARDVLAGVVRVRVDDDGRFAVRLPHGSYRMLAAAPEHAPLRRSFRFVDGGQGRISFALAYSPRIRGVVVDERGVPIPDAVVSIGGAFDPRARPPRVRADDTGRFALPIQQGQELRITARGAGRVARVFVGAVDDVRHLPTLTLVATPGRNVEGVVLRPDGRVHAYGPVHWRVRALGLEGVERSDDGGHFVVVGMPADQDVEVWAEGTAIGAWGARVAATGSTDLLALTFIPPAY